MNRPRDSIFYNALQVTPRRIGAMTDEELNLLMAQLLRAQAYKCGSPINEIRVNTEAKASDDGCDGWSAKAASSDDWFGSTDTCWQFKAGKSSEPKRLNGEITKRIPKEALSRGGRYVLVASGSMNAVKGEQDRLRTLIKNAKMAKLPIENIDVIGSERLANWCNQHPAVAAYWAGRPAGLWTFKDWSNSEEHRVPYQASATVQLEIEARRSELDFATGSIQHLHIYGPPGVGKTRFALELCRDAPWRDSVLYIPNATDLRLVELIDSVISEPGAQLIVVADEVQPEQLLQLRDSVERGGGRVRLVTVGHCSSPDSRRIPGLLVKPLDNEVMQKVIKGWYPSMPLEHVDFIVRFADGYVRLARLAADTVVQNPTMDVRGLLSREEIRTFLDRMLGTGDRRALYVVAVLTSVGWTDDKQEEGKTISEHLGLDWNLVRASVDDFDRRLSIAPRGGRYRYISPTPLGINLAVEAWSTYPDLLKSLPGILPGDAARDAYYDRLQSIASNPQAREYSQEELAFFFRLEDFIDARTVRRWSALSSGDPATAAHNILIAFSDSSLEDRRRIEGDARREVVWTLVRLAWKTSSFHDATKSLGLLAEAENESWGNNASAEFIARFQILLSGTAVPYLDRLSVLDELLAQKRPSLVGLVVKALAQVGNQHAFRTVSGLVSDELPEREWRPRTKEEHLECIVAAITRLSEIVKIGITDIQTDLVLAAEELSMMLRESTLREYVVNFFDAIREGYPEAREPLRRAISDIIRRESMLRKGLSSDERKFLETLQTRFEDSSLKARLQQYLGQAVWNPEEQPDLIPLAKELIDTPEGLTENWPWLTSGDAQNGWLLGKALAVVDSKGFLAKTLPSIPECGRDLRLLCSYIGSQRIGLGDEWYDQWWTSQFEQVPKPISLLIEIVWRCGATEAVANLLVAILQNEIVDPQILGQLGFGLWGEKLAQDSLENLLRVMADTGHSEIAIQILGNRIKSNPAEVDQWKLLALKLVISPDVIRTRNAMVNYSWKEVAITLVADYPGDIAKSILREVADNDRGIWFDENSEIVRILNICVENNPSAVWEEIQPYLLPPAGVKVFSNGFPKGVLDHLPIREIMDWIAEEPEERVVIISRLIRIDLSNDTSLAASILGKYGDKEMIMNEFFSGYISGSWMGESSIHWDQLADSLTVVVRQTHLPKLRRWANDSIRRLRKMAEHDRLREEEEWLRRR